MSKLSLPSVTLACIDCVNVGAAINAVEICKSKCDFADVKLFTSIELGYRHRQPIRHIGSLNDYSAFVLTELPLHIPTQHVLIVQWDGWILNPEAWRPHWLGYDYIGPLFLQDEIVNDQSVGVGGFSFRSTALMLAAAEMLPPWDGAHSYDWSTGNNWGHEDGVLSRHLRRPLLSCGFKFAPPSEAAVFAQGGNTHPDYYVPRPFGFHKMYRNVDIESGIVAPYDVPAQ